MKQMNIKSIRTYGTLYSRYTSLYEWNSQKPALLLTFYFIFSDKKIILGEMLRF